MRASIFEKHRAGNELWNIAQQYKIVKSELDDKTALKLAMLSNPDLAECYTGAAVRRDGLEEVKRYLMDLD